MKMKDIPLEYRPRERLRQQGPSSLSDAELLAIILGNGQRGEHVLDLAHRILNKSSLHQLSSHSLEELQSHKGIGIVKATRIKALFELFQRYKMIQVQGNPLLGAKDVFSYALGRYGVQEKEYFVALHLDAKHRIKKEEIISVGTLTSSLVHPREVFKTAIKESSYALILLHNHPSGDPTPSPEDKEITLQLMAGGDLLGIKVVDHVIIGKENYWSFQEHSS